MNSPRDNGWDASAASWIAHMGERGDWGRQHVLDKVMLERVAMQPYKSMLDVGCGEGRFCRALTARGIKTTGIDPARDLIARASSLDVSGNYQVAHAEALPFSNDSFDLVVSYLTLIDIADFRAGLSEMVRVLKPNGRLLIANLNSFVTSCPRGWIRDEDGKLLHYAVDKYLEEFPSWVEWSDIRIENWHRPLSAYMQELLGLDMTLRYFDEPHPHSGDPEWQAKYRRAPWFMVMEWEKSA
jgi:2-polyprenyl-3-methyl-5-hydroxy-6-metoxy-1,4-benzoquinol methylase